MECLGSTSERAGVNGCHHGYHDPGIHCSGYLEDLGENKEVGALGLVSFIKLPKTRGYPCDLELGCDKEVAEERSLP